MNMPNIVQLRAPAPKVTTVYNISISVSALGITRKRQARFYWCLPCIQQLLNALEVLAPPAHGLVSS